MILISLNDSQSDNTLSAKLFVAFFSNEESFNFKESFSFCILWILLGTFSIDELSKDEEVIKKSLILLIYLKPDSPTCASILLIPEDIEDTDEIYS